MFCGFTAFEGSLLHKFVVVELQRSSFAAELTVAIYFCCGVVEVQSCMRTATLIFMKIHKRFPNFFCLVQKITFSALTSSDRCKVSSLSDSSTEKSILIYMNLHESHYSLELAMHCKHNIFQG